MSTVPIAPVMRTTSSSEVWGSGVVGCGFCENWGFGAFSVQEGVSVLSFTGLGASNGLPAADWKT